MEQVAVLASGKCLRRYSPEHPLFAAGNALRALKYRQDGESLLLYDDGEDGEQDDERDVFQCRLLACDVGFRSVAAYEEHYDLEMHDAFFKVLSKKKPMYACLVDGCEEKFTHDDKRKRHLVQPEKKKRPRKKKDRANKQSSTFNEMDVDQAAEPMREAQETAGVPAHPEASSASSRTSKDPDGIASKDVDMVENLEESMRNLRIPKTLSFGRKQRGRR